MTHVYWLDSIFHYATSYRKDVKSLEGQMNTISKLIVFSFFLMKIFLPLKLAAGLTMGMLFVTSIMYYYLNESYHPMLKENFEQPPVVDVIKKTKLEDIHVYRPQREIYIPKPPKVDIRYKTILPMESYPKLSSPQSKPRQHPETLKAIQPQENLFSQSSTEMEENKKPKSFLQVSQPVLVQQSNNYFPDLEVFQRTNIDHLDVENLSPEQYYEHVDQLFNQKQMEAREKYANQIKEINHLRNSQLEMAPIHQNFRVRGGGGSSFSNHYAGPRGRTRR